MTDSIGFTVFLVALLAVSGICAFMEKNTTLAYKSVGVYGKVSGTLTGMCLLGGIFGFVAAIVPPLRGDSSVISMLISGVVLLVVGVLSFYFMYKKCPADMKGRLLLSILITTLGTWMKISLFIIPLVMKLAGISTGGGSSGFAKSYSCGGNWYETHSEHGNYAYLSGDGGDLIEVRPHGSEGLVTDDAGNIYYPNN